MWIILSEMNVCVLLIIFCFTALDFFLGNKMLVVCELALSSAVVKTDLITWITEMWQGFKNWPLLCRSCGVLRIFSRQRAFAQTGAQVFARIFARTPLKSFPNPIIWCWDNYRFLFPLCACRRNVEVWSEQGEGRKKKRKRNICISILTHFYCNPAF